MNYIYLAQTNGIHWNDFHQFMNKVTIIVFILFYFYCFRLNITWILLHWCISGFFVIFHVLVSVNNAVKNRIKIFINLPSLVLFWIIQIECFWIVVTNCDSWTIWKWCTYVAIIGKLIGIESRIIVSGHVEGKKWGLFSQWLWSFKSATGVWSRYLIRTEYL